MIVNLCISNIGYEPADFTVHPHPHKTAEGGFIFFVFPKKMSSEESLNISEVFRLKDSKTCFFIIFTQTQFLINLTL